MADIEVSGKWNNDSTGGQAYTARAVAKSGRVLSVVKVQVPLDVASDIKNYLGDGASEYIEEAAKGIVKNIADKTPGL